MVRYAFFCSLLSVAQVVTAQPFQIQLPPDAPSQPGDLQLTVFKEGLDYPVGMAELDDGSILVGVSNGSFFASSGQLLRLYDSDFDGVADQESVLADVPIGGLSDIQIVKDLAFVTGQKKDIQVFQLGELPTDPMIHLGEIGIQYPSGPWLHPHSALLARQSPTDPETVELYFQVGSDANLRFTEREVLVSGFGLEDQSLRGDSIYRMNFDTSAELQAMDITHIAQGLRNSAGMVFDETGNLYFQDNGIDGFVDANEPESPDELNFLSAEDLGGVVEDFGFPHSYRRYRTNELIGTPGFDPLVSFQPLDGSESEGPNDIAFPPEKFPDYLQNGLFVTMHGRFSRGGVDNEENPLVFVDLEDNSYSHFISNEEPNIGHIDGLLTTTDALYLADISDGGFSTSSNGTGTIYRLRSTVFDLLADINHDGQVNETDAVSFCSLSTEDRFNAHEQFDSALGDIDLSGQVSFRDFLVMSVSFGQDFAPARYDQGDIDCDGTVAFADFLVLAANFGTGAAASVPEPFLSHRVIGLWLATIFLAFRRRICDERVPNVHH